MTMHISNTHALINDCATLLADRKPRARSRTKRARGKSASRK